MNSKHGTSSKLKVLAVALGLIAIAPAHAEFLYRIYSPGLTTSSGPSPIDESGPSELMSASTFICIDETNTVDLTGTNMGAVSYAKIYRQNEYTGQYDLQGNAPVTRNQSLDDLDNGTTGASFTVPYAYANNGNPATTHDGVAAYSLAYVLYDKSGQPVPSQVGTGEENMAPDPIPGYTSGVRVSYPIINYVSNNPYVGGGTNLVIYGQCMGTPNTTSIRFGNTATGPVVALTEYEGQDSSIRMRTVAPAGPLNYRLIVAGPEYAGVDVALVKNGITYKTRFYQDPIPGTLSNHTTGYLISYIGWNPYP